MTAPHWRLLVPIIYRLLVYGLVVPSPRFRQALGALLVFQHLVGVRPLVAIHPIALDLIAYITYIFDEVIIITGCAMSSIIEALSAVCFRRHHNLFV
jgi:hypothetical protein